MNPELELQLQEAFRAGSGLKDLCEANNLDLNSILKQAKLENWSKPKPSPKPIKVREENDDRVSPIERGHKYTKRLSETLSDVLDYLEDCTPQELLSQIDNVEKMDRILRRSYGLDREIQGGPTLNVNILAQGIQMFATIEQPPPIVMELQNATEEE